MDLAALRTGCSLAALVAFAAMAAPAGAASIVDRTVRVSAAPAGAAPDGPSSHPAISPDGRLVVFESAASNLQGGPGGPHRDVFVRDLATGTIALVSAAHGGAPADGASGNPAIARRRVAFESTASNLVPGDTNGLKDVFLRDLDGGVRLISAGLNGEAANGESRDPDISADGRYVVYSSSASNVTPFDRNGFDDILLHDLQTGRTTRVSQLPTVPGNGRAARPAVSADGRYVTFTSAATNLIIDDENGVPDVFLIDRELSAIERMSISSHFVPADKGVGAGFDQVSDVSANGRYVVFDSDASNLAARDTNRDTDVFVRDRAVNRTSRVSVSTTGRQGSNDSFHPSISGDGRFVVFSSFAENLAPGDGPGEDVFLRDRRTNRTTVVGAPSRGGERAGEAVRQLLQHPTIGDDGGLATFTSTAMGLVPEDADTLSDVFVRRLAAPRPRWVVRPPARASGRRPRYAVQVDDPAATAFVCRLGARVFECPRAGRLPRSRPGRHVLVVYAGGPGLRYSAGLRRSFRITR